MTERKLDPSIAELRQSAEPFDPTKYVGRSIASVALVHNHRLRIEFADGDVLYLWDDYQHCCEDRYMTCEDDLAAVAGGTILGMEVSDGPSEAIENGRSYHDCQFLRIRTTEGPIVVATHNIHNGYYGGFYLRACVQSAAH